MKSHKLIPIDDHWKSSDRFSDPHCHTWQHGSHIDSLPIYPKDDGSMKTHDLKSWPEFFEAVINGTKSFELRLNDRKYAVGDRLHLQEWEPKTQTYSGRECWREVQYVLDGVGPGCIEPLKGLARGYCILGF